MTFQFPTLEFVVFVGLLVGWFLDVRYGAILMLLSGPFYSPRIRRYFRNSIKNALLALSELFSRRGAAAAAVAVLPYLAMIYLGIISQPQRRDAAVLTVLFTFIFVTALFLVYHPTSDPASRTAAAEIEINPKKLIRWNNEDLREPLEAAGKSTEGDKKALVARLVKVRCEAMAENLAVGSSIVTRDGAYGSVAALRNQAGWWEVRLNGEDTDRRMQLGQFKPVTSAPVASLLPFLKDCACAAGASALLYLLLDYLWLFILRLTSSANWRREATNFAVLSTLVGAGVYCLYRHFYCRTLTYKLPSLPPDVPKFVRANGDKIENYLNPSKTTRALLEHHNLLDLEQILDGYSLEFLKTCDYDALLGLGVPAGHQLAQRLYDAIQEISQGPTHFRDALTRFKATGELPEKLPTLKMIPDGSRVGDFLTKRERDLYKDMTGIEAIHYKAPSFRSLSILHRLHRTALARQLAYFKTFHAENEARTLLELPWTRYRMDLLRARQETQTLSRKEVTELRGLEEALPGLERQATARDLAEKGYVRLVPTEERPENWTEADWAAYYQTQEFLQKPRSEQIEHLKDIVAKLTSCACEFGWAAAILALWALFEELFEQGHYDEADLAFERLLRALVRVNFWYSREHYLLCDVPADAIKAVVKETTTSAVEGAPKSDGIKVNLEKLQQRLGLSFRKTRR
jgi:hypothetical protein